MASPRLAGTPFGYLSPVCCRVVSTPYDDELVSPPPPLCPLYHTNNTMHNAPVGLILFLALIPLPEVRLSRRHDWYFIFYLQKWTFHARCSCASREWAWWCRSWKMIDLPVLWQCPEMTSLQLWPGTVVCWTLFLRTWCKCAVRAAPQEDTV